MHTLLTTDHRGHLYAQHLEKLEIPAQRDFIFLDIRKIYARRGEEKKINKGIPI